MNELQTVHLDFTCPHCRAPNVLVATHLHESTMIHCSHCSSPIATLGALAHQVEHRPAGDLRQAG